jgi:hypothetical protein
MWLRLLVVYSLCFLNIDCSKKPSVEGYRVMSFDSMTGEWIFLFHGTIDGKYLTKRLTVVCDFYKWGKHEPVAGRNACNLRVGSLMVRRYERDGSNLVLYIFEDPDRLTIVEGEGDDRVSQQFFILKSEVVSE